MTPSSAQDKDQLREKLKSIRSEVTPDLALTVALSVWNILRTLSEYRGSKGVGAFASTSGEINTLPILEGILRDGKHLYLPKVIKNETRFDFHPVKDLKTMTPGPFGILEPSGHKAAPWKELDLVLVPGLAFDHKGNRLGFGRGYYDRVLPLLNRSTLTVGLGYSFQVVERVPVEPEDIPVAALLTEKGFTYCKK